MHGTQIHLSIKVIHPCQNDKEWEGHIFRNICIGKYIEKFRGEIKGL